MEIQSIGLASVLSAISTDSQNSSGNPPGDRFSF
jgi:hypothetical protein